MLTVLITTHNRLPILEKCLRAIFAGSEPELVNEVIVVDDGSSDDTPQYLEHLKKENRITHFIRNENARGPATARNQGIQHAKSDYTLITGDDVIFTPEAIKYFCRHILRHGLDKASVIGNILPAPENITAFEYWLCNGGSQFGHNRITPENIFDAGDEHFYTSNVVTPTRLLQENKFDESFPYARYEDRELAYRLKKKVGHKIHYLAAAKSYHEHRYKFKNWLQSFDKFAWSALFFSELYPEDSSLRQKLGIDKASKTESFNYEILADAVALVNRYHRQYHQFGERFGQGWVQDWVDTSFRLIQEFFRTGYYRHHLKLPVMRDSPANLNDEDAREKLLASLDETS